jgi:hypothetical protein
MQRETDERDEKNFLPKKFLQAKKYAIGRPTNKATQVDKKACFTVNHKTFPMAKKFTEWVSSFSGKKAPTRVMKKRQTTNIVKNTEAT